MRHQGQTLVILSPGFPENEADTTCLPLQQALLRTIKQQYPELNLLVIAFQYPYKKQSYTWHGIPVEAFGGRGRSKIFRVNNWVRIWNFLKKVNQSHEICGILSFWLGECGFIGERFAKAYELTHHCWVLGQDAKPNNRYFRMMSPGNDSLIALSDFLSRSIRTNYGITPAKVIPGGVDGMLFGAGYDEKDIDILAAGSLIELKQYHLFIEVVCRLRRRFPNIKAVLCGDGPDRERLTQMIRKVNMENHITLMGEVQHKQVLELMQRSKVFLHTSNYEGLGMVCLEALYAGAKVISFVRPIDKYIRNWHIANNTMEMTDIATNILQGPGTEYIKVAPFLIADTAKQIAQLYGIYPDPPAISPKRRAIAVKERVE